MAKASGYKDRLRASRQRSVPKILALRPRPNISILIWLFTNMDSLCMQVPGIWEGRDKMGSVYIGECDGSGIVELLIKKVNELAGTGMKSAVLNKPKALASWRHLGQPAHLKTTHPVCLSQYPLSYQSAQTHPTCTHWLLDCHHCCVCRPVTPWLRKHTILWHSGWQHLQAPVRSKLSVSRCSASSSRLIQQQTVSPSLAPSTQTDPV